MRIIPLASESFGVRSMCTYVETPDVKILLDAGVSLCPKRFGLPPHPLEFKAIVDARKRIAEAAEKAEIVTISHYHFDHHTPSFEDWLCNWTALNETARQIYEEKLVLMKNPKENINYSQRRRGWMFQKTSGKYAKKLEIADKKTFIFGKDTKIKFSKPVFHGSENSILGWVLMTSIEFLDEKIMFAPDVQGPISEYTFKLILAERPHLLIIGGPPLYLEKFKVVTAQIQMGMSYLGSLVKKIPVLILEHHILRDEEWVEKSKMVFEKASSKDHKILTAAEYLGMKNIFLEAKRKNFLKIVLPLKNLKYGCEKTLRKESFQSPHWMPNEYSSNKKAICS